MEQNHGYLSVVLQRLTAIRPLENDTRYHIGGSTTANMYTPQTIIRNSSYFSHMPLWSSMSDVAGCIGPSSTSLLTILVVVSMLTKQYHLVFCILYRPPHCLKSLQALHDRAANYYLKSDIADQRDVCQVLLKRWKLIGNVSLIWDTLQKSIEQQVR